MAQYAKYSAVHPQWESFVKSEPELYRIRTEGGDAIQRRATFRKLAAEGPQMRQIPGNSAVTVRDFSVVARDGYNIQVRSYIPRSSSVEEGKGKEALRLLVYYHGGGWTSGDIETGDDNCRLLCAHNTLVVLNVDYRLAPQHVFPTSVNDAFDVFRWAAENAQSSLQADTSKGFLVGGVSSGANMAAVISYLARDEKVAPSITGLLLSIPCCLLPSAYDLVPQWKNELLSIEQNKDSDLLDLNSYNQLAHDILQAPSDDPRISFLLNPDHSKLPPRAYFQIGGQDILRDESLLFARLLREHSGTETLVHMHSGMPHGWWRFQKITASEKWAGDLFEGTKFLLKGGEGGIITTI
ncbi:Alpha/Beta hydrolase protein [Nemania sp. NC0429]|nr:Alpha/Beta hydrolase protein [Nemania sp. NC0429]